MAGGRLNRAPTLRVLTGCAVLLGLAACETYGPNPSGEVTLPEGTRRINAVEERASQLATGTYHDDIPELTGAPSPRAVWPAYVDTKGKTVYRDVDSLLVGSEGPYAVTQ